MTTAAAANQPLGEGLPLTFEDLIAPDPRTLSFGPYGLGGQLPAEKAVEFQQAAVTRFLLVEAVPDHTRRAFERLQRMHIYGVLCYDLFTVADSQASLVLELALAERFLLFYEGEVPFIVRKDQDAGAIRSLTYRDWDDIFCTLRRGPFRDMLLKPTSGARPFRFTGTLNSLLRWARAEGLLIGQRNRQLDRVLEDFRNYVAHPRFTNTAMPVDSARSIRDLAEIINQLWGHATPGGRLYPAPLERPVVIVGWTLGEAWTQFELFKLPHARLTETSFLALRAVPSDELTDYNSLYETTHYPAELLWGPGTEEQLKMWAKSAPTSSDCVSYLDRLFLIRTLDGRVDPPMRPDVAAGRTGHDRGGHWHLVRADYPTDAFGHVRNRTKPTAIGAGWRPCSRVGRCPNCAVEVLGTGRLDTMLRTMEEEGVAVKPERPPEVVVPSPFRRW
ncbi:MAG: hypothetical protein JWL79_1760 [Frankiales bacterium]|nr:hypothetical protein [Frankiales bacterium]